jgi:hypothetical protein
VRERVHEVAVRAYHEVQVERVILAVGERLESVHHERFAHRAAWTVPFEQQQGVPAQATDVPEHRDGGAAE